MSRVVRSWTNITLTLSASSSPFIIRVHVGSAMQARQSITCPPARLVMSGSDEQRWSRWFVNRVTTISSKSMAFICALSIARLLLESQLCQAATIKSFIGRWDLQNQQLVTYDSWALYPILSSSDKQWAISHICCTVLCVGVTQLWSSLGKICWFPSCIWCSRNGALRRPWSWFPQALTWDLLAPSTTFGTLALQKLLGTRNDHTLRGVIFFQESHAYKSQCESAMNSVLANGVWVGGHMLKVFVAL